MKRKQQYVSGFWALTLLMSSIFQPAAVWAAVDTGGYPWADATLVRAASYDWGYTTCQPAMQVAKTCTTHITTKLGQKYYQSDPWRYDVRNCTSYVAWRMHTVSGIAITGWGNAHNWDNAAQKAGYRVDVQPVRGSIAVWEGAYGHVAYVTAVNPDTTVNVDQYNKAGTGEFSSQSRVKADHYIHVFDQPEPASTVAAVSTEATSSPQLSQSLQQVTPQANVPTAVTPAPPSSATVLEPLKPTAEHSMPTVPGVTFQAVIEPREDAVVVYAIVWQYTKSGTVEVHRTSSSDGNTAWVDQWNTTLPSTAESERQYMIADNNADGMLDLYALGKNTATVLDGAQSFQKAMPGWSSTNSEPELAKQDTLASELQLADYNGDGTLDLFSLSKKTDTVQINILDGKKHFAQPLAQWDKPSTSDVRHYAVGDHDRDGKVDVYQIGTEVTVLSASTNYQQVLSSWKPQENVVPTVPKAADQ